ncbi:MAG: replicative DNA helicase [Bacteroidaceae bacterium]|nr:replicative DNA helicase [Bacteroidaceae bacterium]
MAETTSRSKKTKAMAPINNAYGHLQPQALDVEKAVLGALMMDKDAYSIVCELLKPETFYDPRHQSIYAAVATLSMDQHPIDMLTVAEQLEKDGELDNVGGPVYLSELTSDIASSAHVEYHAKILAQKHLARELISFSNRIETKAFDETVDVNDLMQEAEQDLFGLSQTNMKNDYAHISSAIMEAEDAMRKAAESKGGITGLASGFHKLDDVTAGWQPSDLIILAGRPAMGKTSFALSLCKNIAVDYNEPVAFFSLEMSSKQLANRLISQVCEITGHKILTGQLDKLEWERFDKRVGNLFNAPIYVDDTPGLSIFELRTKARRLVREHHVKMIMIDYLQLMTGSGKHFGSRQEEVSSISQSLKGLAKELDIPILALSQLNRDVEKRDNKDGKEGKRPQLSDLRESGAIEQDADMVIFVHRPEYYHIYQDENGNDTHGKAQIIIAKHRKGATKDVMLAFKGEYTAFLNEEDGYVPPTEGVYKSKLGDGDVDEAIPVGMPSDPPPF